LLVNATGDVRLLLMIRCADYSYESWMAFDGLVANAGKNEDRNSRRVS
jgi:hypothetical protein